MSVKPGDRVYVGPWVVRSDDHDGYWALDGGDGHCLGVPVLVAHELFMIPFSQVFPNGEPCDGCDGKGWIANVPSRELRLCVRCDGTGKQPAAADSDPRGGGEIGGTG